jgi:hypothetical protein
MFSETDIIIMLDFLIDNIFVTNSTAPNLHTDFMDVLNNNALTQLVEEPTRQQNTLDLILTNHPGKVICSLCSFLRFFRISVFIHGLLSLTLVLFCGMCFTADFVIVSLKTFHILVTWQSTTNHPFIQQS